MKRGYLTFVQNNGVTDYLRCAYLQALSLKLTNTVNQYAVVVDPQTAALITDRHRKVFDYIIPIPGEDQARDHKWKMHNEWKALIASPFDETIKVESDILFTANIDHWWKTLSLRDVCFTSHVINYTEEIARARDYRRVFDINQLPDIYAGFYYFKRSSLAEQLFSIAESIFNNWTYVKNYMLQNGEQEPASTDLVFAIAAKIIGIENCTMPGTVPTFVHMKNAIQGWPEHPVWTEMVYTEFDQQYFTVGFHRQRYPFHYNLKNFARDEIIQHYENQYYKPSAIA